MIVMNSFLEIITLERGQVVILVLRVVDDSPGRWPVFDPQNK
jgi:hypothetical protein